AEDEQVILRRLSVFAASFTLDSVRAVASDSTVAASHIADAVENLVAKSLVSADISGAVVHYRLLETTRAYAQQKLIASGEFQMVGRRHAEHHRDLYQRAEVEAARWSAAEWLADYGRRIDDVRGALGWAFSDSGDIPIGVALTVAAIPLWVQLSLLDECRKCVERVLAIEGDDRRPNDRDRMKLLAALGTALLYTRGPVLEIDATWTRALEIAERLTDNEYHLRLLWGLSIYRVYASDHRIALGLARSFRIVAGEQRDLVAQLSGDRLIATTLHYLGRQAHARRRLERMLGQYDIPFHRSHILRFQWDQRATALGTLSIILWLQGFPDQAVRTAKNAVGAAQATDHALSFCNALGHAALPVALYVGDLPAADRL